MNSYLGQSNYNTNLNNQEMNANVIRYEISIECTDLINTDILTKTDTYITVSTKNIETNI